MPSPPFHTHSSFRLSFLSEMSEGSSSTLAHAPAPCIKIGWRKGYDPPLARVRIGPLMGQLREPHSESLSTRSGQGSSFRARHHTQNWGLQPRAMACFFVADAPSYLAYPCKKCRNLTWGSRPEWGSDLRQHGCSPLLLARAVRGVEALWPPGPEAYHPTVRLLLRPFDWLFCLSSSLQGEHPL